MEASTSGAAAQPAVPPKKVKAKRVQRTTEEKWWFYRLTVDEPDLSLAQYTKKFNDHWPNPLPSSTASDWMKPEAISTLKKLRAQNSGKSAKQSYTRARKAPCEKLETALFHWFQGQDGMDSTLIGSVCIEKAQEMAEKYPLLGVPAICNCVS